MKYWNKYGNILFKKKKDKKISFKKCFLKIYKLKYLVI